MADPADIPDLLRWYRADQIYGLSSGDPIARWPDAVGGLGDLTQPTLAARPIWLDNQLNGQPVVRFDAVDDGIWNPTPLWPNVAQPYTIFTVYKWRGTDTGAGRRMLTNDSTVLNYLIGPFFGQYIVYSGDASNWVPARLATTDLWVRHEVGSLDNGQTVYSKVNRTVDGSEPSTGQTGLSLGLCLGVHAWAEPSECDVAEIAIYDRELSAAEKIAVDDYLVDRYFTAGTGPPSTDPGVTQFTVPISDDELVAASAVEGNNLLKVFVKDSAGNWSA